MWVPVFWCPLLDISKGKECSVATIPLDTGKGEDSQAGVMDDDQKVDEEEANNGHELEAESVDLVIVSWAVKNVVIQKQLQAKCHQTCHQVLQVDFV